MTDVALSQQVRDFSKSSMTRCPDLETRPQFLDLLPIAVYGCDRTGQLLWFNRKAVELWGRTPRLRDSSELFCGCHRIHLDGRPIDRHETPMAHAIQSGTPVHNVQAVLERPDGSRSWIMVHIDPIFDARGELVGAVNCFHDTTAAHTTNETLKERQRDLEDFFENAAVALHIVGSDGAILRANKAELDLLGYSEHEYVGRNIAEFHIDPPVIEDIMSRLCVGQKLDKYPARLRARDGSIKHVLITSNAQFRNGQFSHTRCFTVDVTDLKRANEALRERDRWLNAMYENAVVGIAQTDESGRLLRVNQAACAVTGRSREELLTRTIFDSTPPHQRAWDLSHYQDLIDGRIDRYTIEKQYKRPDGREIWMQVMCSAARDAAGRFQFGVRVFHDVTQAKQAELRQKALIDELNHRVKNTLATVQSLAAQTLRDSPAAAEMCNTFTARLFALSRTHDQLSEAGWQSADLRTIVEGVLAPYRTEDTTRAVLNGDALRLAPNCALVLGMVLHELTTNAAKYGSLSVAAGKVAVNWTVTHDRSRDRLLLDWKESGGPPVKTPQRSGFGSRLAQRAIAHELGGNAEIHFDPAGVRCHFEIPLGTSHA